MMGKVISMKEKYLYQIIIYDWKNYGRRIKKNNYRWVTGITNVCNQIIPEDCHSKCPYEIFV